MSSSSMRCGVAFILATLLVPRLAVAQAITVQQPVFGVAVDADGVLSTKAFPDATGMLFAKRVAAAKAALPGDVRRSSDLRKVSLVKLERAIAARLDAGEKPDDAMRHLAGLQRAQHVFFYPDERDIVLAGPADGWVEDLSGRAMGLATGRPTLLLEDLIVALRAYSPGSRGKPFIGCTIDPRPEALAALARFQKTIPKEVPESQRDVVAERVAEGTRASIGMRDIKVFGVSNKTHFAQVLIEADYRMKLIGIGLEAPPVPMTTFLSALNSPRVSQAQRWWFTPNYECVKTTADGLAMELVGQGVQLQGEEVTPGPDGKLVASGNPQSGPSRLFTQAFTKKYADISRRAPVYAQLRNMIDLVVVAAFIRDQDYYRRAEWGQGIFAQEARLPVETLTSPKQVPCAVNAMWKDNVLFVPSGGVAIHPDVALEAANVQADRDGKLREQREKVGKNRPAERWWWD